MKLRYLRLLMAVLAILEVAVVTARWYLSNGGWSSRGNWLFVPMIAIALVLKALDKYHRCPHCKQHLDYQKLPHCPHCKEFLE